MHKRQQRNKIILDYFLILAGIVLSIFFIDTNMVYGSNNNWVEVGKTIAGRQYLDSNSLNSKEKGIIEISTKYLKIDPKDTGRFEEYIYTMQINCLTNKYKDTSVNGHNIPIKKWKDPQGDKLINDVIAKSCENV